MEVEEDHSETALMRMLYDEHAAALWRYAMRLTGDRARAEDVVQETLLRAWQHPEVTEDTERSARAWLFTVARNMIIDEHRSPRFRRENGSLESVLDTAKRRRTPGRTKSTPRWTGCCSAMRSHSCHQNTAR